MIKENRSTLIALYIFVCVICLFMGVLFGPNPLPVIPFGLIIGAILFCRNFKAMSILMSLGLSFFVLTYFVLGWPLEHHMPISGRVIDAVTGEPIENAIFQCRWFVRSIPGGGGGEDASAYAVTDKDGRYKLDGKWIFDLVGPGERRRVVVRHPLYEKHDFEAARGFRISAFSREKCPDPNKGYNNCSINIKSKNGVITYDIKLMKLEDRYKGVYSFLVASNESEALDEYIAQMGSFGTADKIDWVKVFASWEKCVDCCDRREEYKKSELEYLNKKREKVRQMIGAEKI